MKLFILSMGLVLSLSFANAGDQDEFEMGDEAFYSQSELQPPGGGNDPRLFSRCETTCPKGYRSGSGDHCVVVCPPGKAASCRLQISGEPPAQWQGCAAVCACK